MSRIRKPWATSYGASRTSEPVNIAFLLARLFGCFIFCLSVLGSVQRTAAQRTPSNAPVSCAVTHSCPLPFATPDILNVSLANGPINLSAPIIISPAETTQGEWATRIIQANTNQTPSSDEVHRLSQPLDILFGEALTDATFPYSQQPAKVKNSSVVFQVPISFTGTDIQFTGPEYTCDTGGECVPPYVSDGAFGAYYARVEDCLSDSDHPTIKQVVDSGGNAIPCNTADGITGNPGYWYDIAPAWSATAFLGPQSGTTIPGTLKIPAQLPVPTNSVRIEFVVGLTDSLNGAFLGDLYWGNPFQSGPLSGPEWAITRFAVQFRPITVWPAAFLQMKAIPYTILYRPPGDQSVASYTLTQSFGTSMSVGASTTIDNSESFEQFFGVTDNTKITDLIASVQSADGQTASFSQSWDNNTLIGKSLTVSNSTTSIFTQTVGVANPPDTSILPAHDYVLPNTCGPGNYSASSCSVMPGETYRQEPFWGDRFILLLHPQAAIWGFNDAPGIQLLGGANFDQVSVTDLDACAHQSQANAWRLSDGDYLSPTECQELLSLDPFYGAGQQTNPSGLGRGLLVGSGGYGRDPLNPRSTSSAAFSDIFSYTTAKSTNATAFYNSTVTDVIGFSWSEGLTLGYQYGMYGLNLGFSTDRTVTQGDKMTSGTSMKITYTASTVATTTQATQVSGTFADDHDFYTPDCQQSSGNCYHPSVTVFLDELFGSFMFQDAPAACNVIEISCRTVVLASTGLSVIPSGGGPGGRMPLRAAEAAAVLALRSTYHSLYLYAQARPRQGYPASQREIDSTLTRGTSAAYKLTYIPGRPGGSGKIDRFHILAEPLKPGKSASRHFLMDETGTIRVSQAGTPSENSPRL